MASPLDPNDLVTLEELNIRNMWEVSVLIEVLEKKGVTHLWLEATQKEMKAQQFTNSILECRGRSWWQCADLGYPYIQLPWELPSCAFPLRYGNHLDTSLC